jgi:hypothetical protein
MAAVLVAALSAGAAPPGAAEDLDRGNAAMTRVIPSALRPIRRVSPGGNDAPAVIRITTLVANAWFDAIAPYHPTAVGVYSRLGRRPPQESATNRNKNIAILYASYRVLGSVLPDHRDEWRTMLRAAGLDPDDESTDPATAVGIGNLAGQAVVAARERDGMNQLGDEGGLTYARVPFADYTGYQPRNSPDRLLDPGRWQPLLVGRPGAQLTVQTYRTPQWARTRPYSYSDPAGFRAPDPLASDPTNAAAYRQQADEVLAASAALTLKQKLMAEMFDDKLRSLGTPSLWLALTRRFTLDEFVYERFLVHVAMFDGGIATWKEKTRFDGVRPVTAVRHLYGGQAVTAWGGPGKGTVADLPGSEWRSYIFTGDHPEYPSGSACFCAAYAQSLRRWTGSDDFGYSALVPRGSSTIEPGVLPERTMRLGPWATFTDYARDCAMSRVQGGVHFVAAVEAGAELCRPIGDRAYEFVQRHVDGTAP